MSEGQTLLDVEELVVEYPIGAGQRLRAVDGVSFTVAKGETFGLVGESGCGKSSTGRALVCLTAPAGGKVRFEGLDLTTLPAREQRQARRRMQIIFQDPVSSLNPRRSVRDTIAEPLKVWAKELGISSEEQEARVSEMMAAVGLDYATQGSRRPHSFSGGQCQRVSIARALMLKPDLLVCDEPVSALDVSVQAQIINLLEAMKAQYGLTMIFISHDLAVVKHVSDRVGVMYLGRLCEVGPSNLLYQRPAHPYTTTLITSATGATQHKRDDRTVRDVPSPLRPPSGCRFRTRCPRATEICKEVNPLLIPIAPDHLVACHHPHVGGTT
jgi:peptide/nickel transport system ATP-binding protein